MGEYQDDRAWADRYEPELKKVVGSLLPMTASFRLDVEQSTDLIVYKVKHGPRAGQPVGAIGARLRRPGNFWARSFNTSVWWGVQFTIRSHRSSGAETEYSKIMKGFGDWFVYGHIEQTLLRHWMVLDLEVFRFCENKGLTRYESQDNKDGTFFRAYDVTALPSDIFIGASETIRLAVDRGVPAVERLPSLIPPRRLRPPPDLQELVTLHGGYHRITPAAWAQHDHAVEEYRALMRAGLVELNDDDTESQKRGSA